MPIYEYNCKSCGKRFECMQKISEPPIAPCPKCGGTADRIISKTSFLLKGGGWYKDGYGLNKDSKQEKKKSADTSPCTSCSEKCPTRK
ncbi:MAG: zinc ribbon domain-containing protein [Pseudomonadota bacterium]